MVIDMVSCFNEHSLSDSRVPERLIVFFPVPSHTSIFDIHALPAIMKVLANLKSLEIKLCHCPSPTSPPLRCEYASRPKATVVDPELDVQLCAVVDVGALSRKVSASNDALEYLILELKEIR
ncbi:hypothetical protein SADUNF_Sadunf01G0018800 [Salix dunnii]|uniref:Uncharacterized protein n=1 Tax=Salix dunnii TaxID=1413687 RepID=A0A835N9E4_9ROSI|nr:hypothetical protein SADUNF_Sadunf01G0018800 [Salix dunnii]